MKQDSGENPMMESLKLDLRKINISIQLIFHRHNIF